MSIVTPADLRKTYGQNLPASNDLVWQDCIDTAEAQCRRVIGIGRDWRNSEDVYFDHLEANGGVLVLRRSPVISLTVAVDDGSRSYPDNLEEGTDYRLDKASGVVFLYGRPSIPRERDAIRCSVTYGWEADSFPPDLKRAVVWTALFISKMTASNQIGVTQRTTDGGTESIEQSMVPNAVYRTLESYRIGGMS